MLTGKARRAVLGPLLAVLLVLSVAILVVGSPGPVWTFVLILAAAVSVGGLALLFVPGQLTQPQKNALGAALAIATFLAAYLAIPGIRPEPRPVPSPTPTEIPSTSTQPSSPAAPSATPSPTEVLFDDFETKLDHNKWALPSAKRSDPEKLKQIYVEGGKLHLVVSPTNSAKGIDARLSPIIPGGAIKRISMNMALVRQQGGSDGGAYLIVMSAQGREQRLWMGPDGDKNPAVGYYICNKGTCPNQVGAHFSQYPLEKGREFAVEAVVKKDGGLQFNVSGQPSASASPDTQPISNFFFFLYSDPRRNFHVTVDDVRITYDR